MNCKECDSWKNYIRQCVYFHFEAKDFPDCTIYSGCTCGKEFYKDKQAKKDYYNKIVWKYAELVENKLNRKPTIEEVKEYIQSVVK